MPWTLFDRRYRLFEVRHGLPVCPIGGCLLGRLPVSGHGVVPDWPLEDVIGHILKAVGIVSGTIVQATGMAQPR
jgi:hypothetical protein